MLLSGNENYTISDDVKRFPILLVLHYVFIVFVGYFYKLRMASRYALRRIFQSSQLCLLQRTFSTNLHRIVPAVSRSVQSQTAPLSNCLQTRTYAAQSLFKAINIQDTEDFQKRVLDNSLPVIVDFHATWCGPCKMLGPRLESVISSKEGKVVLAKIDVDDNSELAIEYGVQSVPTVMAVKGGKITGKFIGVVDDDNLDVFVEKLIN